VPQLRELVDLGAGEQPADPREARILCHGERRTRRIVVHLAELEHPQGPAAPADALGPVEDGTAGLEHDQQRDDRDERQGREQHDAREGDVDPALERGLDEARHPDGVRRRDGVRAAVGVVDGGEGPRRREAEVPEAEPVAGEVERDDGAFVAGLDGPELIGGRHRASPVSAS